VRRVSGGQAASFADACAKQRAFLLAAAAATRAS
jgi:hypothetical protein